jgi:hypothetical protein
MLPTRSKGCVCQRGHHRRRTGCDRRLRSDVRYARRIRVHRVRMAALSGDDDDKRVPAEFQQSGCCLVAPMRPFSLVKGIRVVRITRRALVLHRQTQPRRHLALSGDAERHGFIRAGRAIFASHEQRLKSLVRRRSRSTHARATVCRCHQNVSLIAQPRGVWCAA